MIGIGSRSARGGYGRQKESSTKNHTTSVAAAIAESPCYGKQNQGRMVVPSEKQNERPGGTLTVFIRGNSRGEKSGQAKRPGGTL